MDKLELRPAYWIDGPNCTYEELRQRIENIYEQDEHDVNILEYQSPQDWRLLNMRGEKPKLFENSYMEHKKRAYWTKERGFQREQDLIDWYWHNAACIVEGGIPNAQTTLKHYEERSITARERYYLHSSILKDIFLNHDIGKKLFTEAEDLVKWVCISLARRAIYLVEFFVAPESDTFAILFEDETIEQLKNDLIPGYNGQDFIEGAIAKSKDYAMQEFDFIKRYLALKDVLERMNGIPSHDKQIIEELKMDKFLDKSESNENIENSSNDVERDMFDDYCSEKGLKFASLIKHASKKKKLIRELSQKKDMTQKKVLKLANEKAVDQGEKKLYKNIDSFYNS